MADSSVGRGFLAQMNKVCVLYSTVLLCVTREVKYIKRKYIYSQQCTVDEETKNADVQDTYPVFYYVRT